MGRTTRFVAAASLALAGATAAAPPKIEDSMAQRMLACTGCHGKEGRAASDGYYPRIAGKPAGYLYNQLLNFRDGRRGYALMGKLLAPLDDAYLREIAGHFAALDLPYPPQAAGGGADPAALQRGERLVREGDPARKLPACVQCHGDAMTGIAPAVPGLLGLPRDYVAAQLGAWRTGQRAAQPPDCMAHVAKQLAPEEIGALAHWLAAQPVPLQQAKALPQRGAGPWPLPCGGVPP